MFLFFDFYVLKLALPIEFLPISSMNYTDHRYQAVSWTDFGISVYFVLEIVLRMFAMTLAIYFSKRYWYNILDSIIVALGLILSVVDLLFIYHFDEVF